LARKLIGEELGRGRDEKEKEEEKRGQRREMFKVNVR
jgi:hypothetical protein